MRSSDWRSDVCSADLHGKGAAGKWTDAATGDHGDLLDLIALNRGHDRLADTLDEARRFLSMPRPAGTFEGDGTPAPRGSCRAARRLFAASRPIGSTLAEAYLRLRGIVDVRTERWLRFHPSRSEEHTSELPSLMSNSY